MRVIAAFTRVASGSKNSVVLKEHPQRDSAGFPANCERRASHLAGVTR